MRSSVSERSTESRRIRAEAANWVACLHGPQRTADIEAGLKRWLAEDPAHAAAFELATDKWDASAGLSGGLPRREPSSEPDRSKALIPALACSIALCIVGGALYYYLTDGVVTTATGEQRTVNLPDGTRVELNTHTRLRVLYDDHERKVVLQTGEAYFDVAKHQSRPFVVYVGDRKVIALGTTFVVRTEDTAQPELAVTLIEGQVAVAPIAAADEIPPLPPVDVKIMSAGQRMRLSKAGAAQVDTPSIQHVTAWQRGQLVFDSTPLLEAAAEFNRYSTLKITVNDPQAATIRIGGAFRTGDALAFAQAMAESHHLQLTRHGREIVLDPLQVETQGAR
jgi:transmembrane sensor